MKRIIPLLLLLCVWLPVTGQIIGHNIVVNVTPDHKDWNYKTGEKAKFTVEVLKSGTRLDNAVVDYEAGPVMYPDVKKSGVTLKEGTDASAIRLFFDFGGSPGGTNVKISKIILKEN